ncbi:MAG TPA: dihydrofolate reductase family protein [Gemmatimonadales bacterium]
MSTAGKLTVTMFLTVDGVYQAPGAPDEDRDGGFQHGGWLVPYFDEDMGPIVDEAFGKASAFLLGGKTYRIFASHWPRVTDPADQVAAALNRLPKYVVSKTLAQPEWSPTTVIRGDVAKQVADLKRRHEGEIQVHGSGALARLLFAEDLVDECHLWTYPVVLGSGKRLFEPGARPAALRLIGTRTTSTGVVVHSYRRAGVPTYGAFGLETAEQA